MLDVPTPSLYSILTDQEIDHTYNIYRQGNGLGSTYIVTDQEIDQSTE